MKKILSAREFLHGFSKVQKALHPGESVTITNRGKPLGKFVKEAPEKKVLPNFFENACADGYGPEVGESLLKKLLEDEALS